MAKTKWTAKDTMLTVAMPDTKLTATFDMKLLYADYEKLPEVVQTTLMYGTKQKLADCIAKGADEKLTDQEAVDTMTERYKDICNGNFNKVGTPRGSFAKDAEEVATAEELEVLARIKAKIKVRAEAKAKEKLDTEAKLKAIPNITK
jgi:hypothetical protein